MNETPSSWCNPTAACSTCKRTAAKAPLSFPLRWFLSTAPPTSATSTRHGATIWPRTARLPSMASAHRSSKSNSKAQPMIRLFSRGALLAILCGGLLLPCPAAAQEKKNLRIAFVSLSWNAQLPFRIATAKGFFKDQGLTVEPIFVRGGPTAIAALISGSVDFASIGGAQAAIRSKARGLDVNIISSLSNYTNYTLIGAEDNKRLEDLRGKIVGVTGAGTFSDFTIRLYLKRNNIDPDKDVQLRAIGQTVVRAGA